MGSRLNPYLTFQGNAREAMEFYRDVLGGELTFSTFAEGGMPHEPADAEKIMHAQLETPSGFTLMASDSAGGGPAAPMAGVQISLSGDAESDAELSGYYDKLAAAGTVLEPLVVAPWGDKFGMVTDRFGVLWMVNIAGSRG
ncbi:MAG TPA: VOC family protein [Candidatus Limnocylindria bacterium]